MKLCWDDIENVRLTKHGNFRDMVKKKTYYLKICEACGEEFLGKKNHKFCCNSCAHSGKNSPWYGKKRSDETKEKISHAMKGVNHPMYGKKFSDEARRNMSHAKEGKKHSDETKEKMSRAHKGINNFMYGKTGENCPSWKGGYRAKDIPTYDTYAPQLDWCEDEEVRRNPDDENVLEVRCTYCGKWFVPSLFSVRRRIEALEGKRKGEHKFYCSDPCKKACPIYHKSAESLMKQDAIRAGRMEWLELDREVQPELRKMVLERDEYTCQKCDITDKALHCHHILPVATDPIESADIDNCITYCINCHKQAHDQDGCRYKDLQTEMC